MQRIENIQWQNQDFSHTFVKALHLALTYKGADMTMAQVAGRTGMAFRTMVHKELCPSAMSMYDWKLLAEGAANCGYSTISTLRLWNEEHLEEERRLAAIEQIIATIDKGVPAVVWDVAMPEWEIISGYSRSKGIFEGLSTTGKQVRLPFSKLGRREIPILFVLTVEEKNNGNTRSDINKILEWALDAVSGSDATERPDYESGYKAYKVWSDGMSSITENDWPSRYYLLTYERMKCYAAEYMEEMAGVYPEMKEVAELFDRIHRELAEAVILRNAERFPESEIIGGIQNHLLKAGDLERIVKDKLPILLSNR